MTAASEIGQLDEWFKSARFNGITRVYTAREVIEQRGTIPSDYIVARDAAERFYERLRELYKSGKSITTFGPYSPGQAVAMKRAGIDGIYLGGWATSAKGSANEDPGPIRSVRCPTKRRRLCARCSRPIAISASPARR